MAVDALFGHFAIFKTGQQRSGNHAWPCKWPRQQGATARPCRRCRRRCSRASRASASVSASGRVKRSMSAFSSSTVPCRISAAQFTSGGGCGGEAADMVGGRVKRARVVPATYYELVLQQPPPLQQLCLRVRSDKELLACALGGMAWVYFQWNCWLGV